MMLSIKNSFEHREWILNGYIKNLCQGKLTGLKSRRKTAELCRQRKDNIAL